MTHCNLERDIGETMTVVLRERLVELESLASTSGATEETAGRLAYVRKMLILFDAKCARRPQAPAESRDRLEW